MSYNLDYLWKATLKDGTVIDQIEASGKENTFLPVSERISEVVSFEVSNNKDFTAVVDLNTGFFYLNGVKFVPTYNDENPLPEEVPKRVIYFRTVASHFGAVNGTEVLAYCIGWQSTFQGRNYKHIMRILSDGAIMFE